MHIFTKCSRLVIAEVIMIFAEESPGRFFKNVAMCYTNRQQEHKLCIYLIAITSEAARDSLEKADFYLSTRKGKKCAERTLLSNRKLCYIFNKERPSVRGFCGRVALVKLPIH